MTSHNISPLLDVQNLCITITDRQNKPSQKIRLLDHISFTLNAGECLAVIGENGSGKSTLGKALLGLCPALFNMSGNVIYNKKNLANLPTTHQDWSDIRGKKIALIPQNSLNAFNPLLSIGHQIYETINRHIFLPKESLQQLIQESFCAVTLPHYQKLFTQYPHELSGGTMQRICIALTFILKPDIIIADEPTSSIDWLSKKEILHLFKYALYKHHQSILLITHDLTDVKELAHNALILQHGQIIEQGKTSQILCDPSHHYTKSLINVHDKLDRHFHNMLHSRQ